jgi:hypothetical protein
MILLMITIFIQTGCSYRFVDPFPASDYALARVGNSSPEPGLAPLLEEELRRNGGFKEHSAYRLSVTVTDFTETVESVSSSGSPVRQKLTMDIAWKVEGASSSETVFGKETAVRSYPYSADPSTLDWNRSAAVRLLAEMAARRILENLKGKL